MIPVGTVYGLHLTGGTSIRLAAGDSKSADLLNRLALIMQLEPDGYSVCSSCLWLTVDPLFSAPEGQRMCQLSQWPPGKAEVFFYQLMKISSDLQRMLLSRGALLLHSALAVYPDPVAGERGVLLAAAGGTGKSTAVSRLQSPWRALCDDAVLVAMESDFPEPRWRAHPWPTWSRLLDGGPGGSWPVETSVSLGAVYFLNRDNLEWIQPLGRGQAAVRLQESARQIGNLLLRGRLPAEKRSILAAQFEQAVKLAKSIPCADLHLTLHGAFWQDLEQELTQRLRKAGSAVQSDWAGVPVLG